MPHAMRDDGNVLRQTGAVKKRDAGNTLRTIALIKKRDASNVLRTVFSALSASAAPAAVAGYGNSASAVDITTAPTTATPTGGVAPYTYAWSSASGWTVNSPTSATTSFTATGVIAGSMEQADFTCTVTDAATIAAQTNAVTATAQNLNAS